MTSSDSVDLHRLIYRSRPQTADLRSDLDAILSVAVWANARHGVTGVLAYSDQVYLQVIEGPRRRIDTLLDCLLRDDRHAELSVLDRGDIVSRLFPGWSMAKAPLPSSVLAEVERGDAAVLTNRLQRLFEQNLTRVA